MTDAGTMSRAAAVGLVGASGAVGRAALAELVRLGVEPIRAGLRHARSTALPSPVQVWPEAVDVTDAAALRRFCAGCRVVVDCAGPTHVTAWRVAAAALATGAHLVDVNAPEELAGHSAPEMCGRSSVLIAAGAMPGLSGLLARWLASSSPFPSTQPSSGGRQRLTARLGGLLAFTPAAAADLIAQLLKPGGEIMAAWRDGRRVPAALRVERDVRLPFFPEPVTAVPFLLPEIATVAASLAIHEACSYTVFAGEHTFAVLERYGAGLAPGTMLAEAASTLARASASDLAGRRPHHALTYQLDDIAPDGSVRSRSLVVTAQDASALTGVAAALGALAILQGEVPAGLHRLADALDPARAWAALATAPAVHRHLIFDAPLATGRVDVEEGEL